MISRSTDDIAPWIVEVEVEVEMLNTACHHVAVAIVEAQQKTDGHPGTSMSQSGLKGLIHQGVVDEHTPVHCNPWSSLSRLNFDAR